MNISFHEGLTLDPTSSASFTFSVEYAIHLYKLAALEQLCFDLTSHKIDFFDADEALTRIKDDDYPGQRSRKMKFALVSMSCFTCSLLFFGGSWVDCTLSGLLGGLSHLIEAG